MLSANIVPQSAGSLSVAILALLMLIVQALFFFRKPQLTWYGWSAAASFSAMLYSIGIFLEYNATPGPLSQFAGRLEFMALICLIHSLLGFTFAYLKIKSKRYHPIAGLWHIFILILLWFTDSIVAETFVSRDFIALKHPYFEPALGPLGPLFILYVALASIGGFVLWVVFKGINQKHRIVYLTGFGIWLVLGIQDGLTAMGIIRFQYLMEYGFLVFACAVLWVVFSSYTEILEEEKYRMITEFANDCILVIQDGQTVFANPAYSDLTGRPLSDSGKEDFLDLVLPQDRQGARAYFSTPPQVGQPPDAHRVRIKRSDGEERFVEIGISFIQYRSRPAVLAIMRDMTERKRDEAARLENEKKLARLRKMESLGLLAGGVAHDLNNVLTGIIGYPDLILLELPEDSHLRKPIKMMQDSGQRAVAIVQDLLTVARGVVVAREPLNLNDLIHEYLESPEHQKLLQFHATVSVKTDLAPELLNIRASRVHILKIVMNLVSNASEAIEGSGQVSLSTENRYVDKAIRNYENVKKGEYAVLSVSDDGPGIPAEDFERIFEPFYTKKVMGRSGTGLGLTLVYNVIHDHEGYIDVKSDKSGTTFELYFPITRDEVAPSKVSLPIEDLSGNGELILIVDDVESQREIASEMLQKLNYRTKTVSSGEAAVEYFRGDTADLILLDMIMDPGINGCQTYAKILRLHPGQKAIIISGYAETEDVREAQRLGAKEYLKKPFTLEALGLTVKKELKRQG